MKINKKERIKQAVRESYSKVATQGTVNSDLSSALSCCGPSETSSTTETANPCCGPELTPEKMSATMGYSAEEMLSVPEGANLGLGCGNPVALASLITGETVVDLGSGGGFDCFLAAKEVGESGHVIGIDMTPEMISKARVNGKNRVPLTLSSDWGRSSTFQWQTTSRTLSCPTALSTFLLIKRAFTAKRFAF